MPARSPRMRSSGANGCDMLNRAVRLSGVSMLSMNCTSALVLASSRSRARSMWVLTASALSSSPSWNFTFGRIVKTIESPSSETSQFSARLRLLSGTSSVS